MKRPYCDDVGARIEIHRNETGGLTLAVTVERKVLGYRVASAGTGEPVAFRLEVDVVRSDRVVPVETNHLQTLMGQPVEYSFRRGRGDGLQSVRLELTPVGRVGELLEVAIDISGSLPGSDRRLLLGRNETLFSSRGVTSTVTVTNGTPPTGYRFRITPDF